MSENNSNPLAEDQFKDNIIRNLLALNQLILDAYSMDTYEKLSFLILNKTVTFTRYSRAVLFRGMSSTIVGISGTSKPDRNSRYFYRWREIAAKIRNKEEACIISEDSLNSVEIYAEYSQDNNGTSACWLPLVAGGVMHGALLLERWDGDVWVENDLKSLDKIIQAYGSALAKFKRHTFFSRKRILKYIIAAVVIVGMVVGYNIPVPYRIVAPCEVIPEDPYSVTAQTNGVIKDVLVKPGDSVTEDQLLISYDKDVAEQELKTYEQEINITYADYERATVQSLQNSQGKSEINLLANKLAQDKTRYMMVLNRLKKMDLYSPQRGVVIMPDWERWEGKPVVVGERIMQIADPARTKVRIGIPVNERLKFKDNLSVSIMLNSNITGSYNAELSYVDISSSISETGVPEYSAEAKWRTENLAGVSIGMKGTAYINGDDVRFGNWLLRRPIASVRRFFGW